MPTGPVYAEPEDDPEEELEDPPEELPEDDPDDVLPGLEPDEDPEDDEPDDDPEEEDPDEEPDPLEPPPSSPVQAWPGELPQAPIAGATATATTQAIFPIRLIGIPPGWRRNCARPPHANSRNVAVPATRARQAPRRSLAVVFAEHEGAGIDVGGYRLDAFTDRSVPARNLHKACPMGTNAGPSQPAAIVRLDERRVRWPWKETLPP
jgi:hypothetical protein